MTDYSNGGDERKSKAQLVRELASLREKVADTNRLLAELIRNYKEAPIGLGVFDPNLCYVHINDWLAEINGVPVEEHLGRTVREVLPDVAEGVEPQFRQVIETGEPILGGTVEAETPARPGIRRMFRHNYYPVKSGDGTVVGVSCVVEDVTAQNRTEAALRDSEARFRDFAKSSSDWFWEMDADLRYTYFSPAYEQHSGLPPEDIVGRTRAELYADVIPELTSEEVEQWENFNRLVEAREAFNPCETKWVRPNGEIQYFATSGTPVFDTGGEFKGYRGVGSNITERKRAEEALQRAHDELERRVADRTTELQITNEALRESDARLRDAIESISEGFILFDADERLVLCNRTALKYYEEIADTLVPGVRFEEFARSMAESGLLLGAIGCEEAWIADRVAQFRNPSGPKDYALSDGRWIQLREYKTASGGTAVLRIDITESKQAEEALQKSEERYRELFDESPVAIWEEDWSPIKQMLDDLARGGVKDWRGYFHSHRDQLKTAYDLAKVIEISLATVDLYRKESKEELLRMSTAAVVIDEELDAFLEIVLAFLAGRMSFDIEAKDMAGDGSEIIVRRRVVIPPKYRVDWARVIYAIEDVTERARAEGQLRQAQKMEAVGQLTGGVAHDFNNLLAVIQGNAQLLAHKEGSDASLTDAILRATARGAELTRRLLAFSRHQPLRPQVIDLGALVSGMSQLLTRTLGATIEIKIAAAPDLWTASADPGQVENAVLNLALNARDAMPEGGKLTIECQNARLDETGAARKQEAAAGDYVVLAVSDTGWGMSAEVLEHVFEPFFTTKEVGQGSGLGLSMIYGFAQQSGGHVTIYSEEGQGTTVKLYLARAEGASQSEETRQSASIPEGRGEVVMVIEDDDDVRAMAREMLEAIGYRVVAAADAARARSVLERGEKVDLVLLDVVLPGGTSGPEFAEEVQASHPDLPIIFMSGYPAEAAKHNGFLGSDQVMLSKPFQMEQLATALREALG